ncbi:MAG: hypothetical protein AW07_03328 [Candidatus Accumulibacter sp. SK-11]|nr:MAG: hypothetical protein AW07_03328 [Candidatus Accumulibacter sp. SK-11]
MIEYDQPITERKMTAVTHIRCASEKAPGSSPKPIVLAV